MDKLQRKKMVLAMEYICRQINADDVFMPWLMCGVADGDLEYGEWNPDAVDECYIDDETFAELMETFLRRMSAAKKSAGLYCDGVVSKE